LHPGSVIQRRPRDGYQEHDRASVTSRKLCYFFTIGPSNLNSSHVVPLNLTTTVSYAVATPQPTAFFLLRYLTQSNPKGRRAAQRSTKLMHFTCHVQTREVALSKAAMAPAQIPDIWVRNRQQCGTVRRRAA